MIALAAISVPHYLVPIWGGFDDKGSEIVVAAAVIAGACVLNILNVTGRGRQRSLAFLALADLGLQLAVIVVGVIVVMHPDRLTEQIHLFSHPNLRDIIYAAVVAMLAYAGIEAASDLAPDIEVSRRDLKRIASLGAVAVPLVYAGMAAIALMAVPVVAGPHGPETALGDQYIQDPVLGVVSAFHPHWFAEIMRWVVALVAAPVLFWAATTSMLGVSRHTYTLAINRQIPSWLGKLEPPPGDALRGDHDLRADRARPRDPDQHQGAGRALRLRRDAGDHDRPPLDHPPADEACPTRRAPSASPGEWPGAGPSCRSRR